jgi:hypothetical protein
MYLFFYNRRKAGRTQLLGAFNLCGLFYLTTVDGECSKSAFDWKLYSVGVEVLHSTLPLSRVHPALFARGTTDHFPLVTSRKLCSERVITPVGGTTDLVVHMEPWVKAALRRAAFLNRDLCSILLSALCLALAGV